MPCCPSCKSNERVGPHAFRDNHFGRVVVDLTETYYVLGRRYICLECKNKSHHLKAVLQETAAANNIQIDEVRDNEVQYTFMGWNDKSLPLFPCGIGNKFPAILTWKAGLDKKVVDMMRPLFDGGCRPDRLSTLLLEMLRRVKRKNDTLLALNERIVPICEGKETNKPIEDNGDGSIIKLQQCLPLLHVPPRKQILPGEMIPLPQPQAIIHTSRPMVVGGVSIENSLGDESSCSDLPVLKKRGRPPGSRSINGNRTRSCGRCGNRGCRGTGRAGQNGCQYINEDGSEKIGGGSMNIGN
jgi:hypothetical protein